MSYKQINLDEKGHFQKTHSLYKMVIIGPVSHVISRSDFGGKQIYIFFLVWVLLSCNKRCMICLPPNLPWLVTWLTAPIEISAQNWTRRPRCSSLCFKKLFKFTHWFHQNDWIYAKTKVRTIKSYMSTLIYTKNKKIFTSAFHAMCTWKLCTFLAAS